MYGHKFMSSSLCADIEEGPNFSSPDILTMLAQELNSKVPNVTDPELVQVGLAFT